MLNLLKQLCALSGVSSWEDEVRNFIRAQAQPYADSIRTDAIGTGNRMAEKILQEMMRTFRTNPADVTAAIGPSIGKCCFQMDEPVLALFRKNIPWTEEIVEKDPAAEGKYKMDLWECNRRLLAEMGVRDIEISGLCTKCDQERFYSHRGMGEKRGVMAGVIELR